MVQYYKVPIDFTNIKNVEKTVKLDVDDISVKVSISPIMNSNKVAVTIIQENEPLVVNEIRQPFEYFLKNFVDNKKFGGDFCFVYVGESYFDGDLDVDLLGSELLFAYAVGDDL